MVTLASHVEWPDLDLDPDLCQVSFTWYHEQILQAEPCSEQSSNVESHKKTTLKT